MADFFAAIGLVLVIEGALYALAPGFARKLASAARDAPLDGLRIAGVAAVGVGVAIVWWVRG